MYLAYDTDDGRIVRRAWADAEPAWVETPPEGCGVAHEPGFSQSSRDELMGDANALHVAGEDYDPETEMSVAYLTYDEESGRIEPGAEIRERPDTSEGD